MEIKWGLLIVLILACNLIGSLGTIWTSSDSAWYKKINKPSFNPPSWVFGPVWTLLFTLMGIALYIVWVSPPSGIRTTALIFFSIQFLFNVLWSYLFFGANNLFLSFVEILILLGLILVTGIYFFMTNVSSGYLILPYFLWVAFASFLNYSIWILNRKL